MKRYLFLIVLAISLLTAITGVSVAYLTTETRCTYAIVNNNAVFGHQTNWEKLVGGICH